MTNPVYIDSPDMVPDGSKIYIYGSGGKGKQFLDLAIKTKRSSVAGFLDTFVSGSVYNLPKIHIAKYIQSKEDVIVVCSYAQCEIIELLIDRGFERVMVYCEPIRQRQLNISISSACNGKCVFCVSSKYPRNTPSWTLDEFEKVKPYIDLVDEVIFCGGYGEAFLNKEIFSQTFPGSYERQKDMGVWVPLLGFILISNCNSNSDIPPP